jgi:hypothetical protein
MSRPDRKLPAAPTNFLLSCSDTTLAAFELARLSEVANLRSELHALLDRMIDATAQASLARWFKTHDREKLKREIEATPDVLEWAKEQLRNKGRSPSEVEEGLLDALSLDPGQAHHTAAATYQERNLKDEKCALCPKPLARHSVRYCETHLAAARDRAREKSKLLKPPQDQPAAIPDTFTELGIPPDKVAASLKAARESLLERMPKRQAEAMTVTELSLEAKIPIAYSRNAAPHWRRKWTLMQKALEELVSAGAVRRIGPGQKKKPFRYFAK